MDEDTTKAEGFKLEEPAEVAAIVDEEKPEDHVGMTKSADDLKVEFVHPPRAADVEHLTSPPPASADVDVEQPILLSNVPLKTADDKSPEQERRTSVTLLTGDMPPLPEVDPPGPDYGLPPAPTGLTRSQTTMIVTLPDNRGLVHNFQDHYTLSIPSSIVRFRGSNTATRVIANQNHQLLLEEHVNSVTNEREVIIKRMSDGSNGAVQFLRLTYTLVCAFWTGFLIVFCVQVLLFLVLDLAIEIGVTSKSDPNFGAAVGVILSIPIFVFGLASALVIAGHYLVDTWRGHPLIKNFVFSSFHPILTEWIAFAFYLGIPLFIMAVTLIAKTPNWWIITSLVWFYCIFIFYIFFTVNVVWYETRACWEIMRNRFDDDLDNFRNLVGRSILVRQVNTYSGEKRITYLARGSLDVRKSTRRLETQHAVVDNTRRETKGPWAKFTLWVSAKEMKWRLFDKLAEPEQVFTLDEARGVRPFVTSYTWSLEKFYCRPRNSRYIAVVRGPGALTQAQIWSSLLCTFIGNFLFVLLLIGGLIWLSIPAAGIVLILVIFAFAFIPRLRSNYELYQTTKNLIFAGTGADEEGARPSTSGVDPIQEGESEGVYLVLERKRLAKPTDLFCWIIFILEVGTFFLYPLSALFRVHNYPLGILFIIVAGVSALRYYVNAAVVLEETGHLNLVDGDEGTDELWKNQSRLNEIVGNITRAKSRHLWNLVLGVIGFAFLSLFLEAIGQKSDSSNSLEYVFLNDFYYEQKADLPYPTCQFGKGFADAPTNNMADYAFLAGLAYRKQSITQGQLDGWFGGNITVDAQNIVNEFRSQADNKTSAVEFKLIRFPNKNASIIAIRGTTNSWDELTDAQLWSAAFLMQIIREILPVGYIWTPILDHLVNVIKTVESQSIDRVSFYKLTTKFAKELQRNSTFGGLQVTGHSLGGGLSIITGAQAGVPAVALSGPNAKISRLTFDPPVTLEQLDTLTFNIIPERDIVPMIDDRAELYQKIQCRTAFNDFLGCHDSTRSLCEIITTCGTGNRPALCECATMYGYDPPKSNGTRTFLEACADQLKSSPFADSILANNSTNTTANSTISTST